MGTCGGPILVDRHGLCEDCSDAGPQEVLLRFHQRDTSGAGVYTTVLLTPRGELVDWELHCQRLARWDSGRRGGSLFRTVRAVVVVKAVH